LWLTHLLCALRHTQGRPRVVVDYDRLLAAPERELARMARGIGLPAATTQREDAHVYAREFLTRALRHAQYAPDELDAVSVPPLVLDAHALAQALARDDADAGDPATAARVDALWARLAALSPLLDYPGAVERAADEVPRLTGELAWARASLADATTFNEDLEAAVARKDAQLAEARAYGDDLKAALDRKEGELVAAHATLARIGERVLGRMLLRGIARKP
jgi:hypothetical protein